MKINKIVVIASIIVILLIVGVPTTYKIIKDHNDKLVEVTEKEIKSAAIKCYYENKCNEVITLKELYDLKYLEEKQVNPITREIYNENSYIEVKDNKFTFKVVD